MVTFEGDSISEESSITDLILNYNIGGVVLLPEDNNFTGYGDPQNTPKQIADLTNDLQYISIFGSIPQAADVDLEPADDNLSTRPEAENGNGIPIFIASNLDGNPYGSNRILGGLTGVPTKMAIGATWQPNYAQEMGRIAY